MPKSFRISDFKGLNERKIQGTSPQETSSLDNVVVRHGKVFGRKGINEFRGITTASGTTPIIGLAGFYRASTQALTVVRMTPTAVHALNTGTDVWDVITGTALTASSTAFPNFDVIDDTLVFTNGVDRPRKYTGTGNTADIAASTAPYAKVLVAFQGLLFLANASQNGTFTDLPGEGPIIAYYSDDWDSDWGSCTSDFIILDETPGEIRAARVLGRSLLFYKYDGIVRVTAASGATRFNQELLPFDKGIIAPLSLQTLGETGNHIFLATDMELYVTNGQQVKALPPNVNKTLQETLSIANAKTAVGVTEHEQETYHLLYNRTGGTWLDGRISYNFRTGEFYHASYPASLFVRALNVKLTPTTAEQIIASGTTLVYELDTGQDDNGTALTRRYDTDWFKLGGDSYMLGAELTFAKTGACRAEVSVAKDFGTTFEHKRTYDLRGTKPSDTEVRIKYRIPSTYVGTWFNFRVRLYHDGSTNIAELKSIEPEFEPLHETTQAVTHNVEPKAAQ